VTPSGRTNARLILSAFGFRLCTLPLDDPATTPPDRRYRRSPSHVPCKSRRPGSRRLYAGHHLARNAGTRQTHLEAPAGSPDSDATLKIYDASTATPDRHRRPSASGTSSRSPPDAINAAPFPCRSPRRSSANAAQGGLAPAPAGPTLEGQQASISHTASPLNTAPT